MMLQEIRPKTETFHSGALDHHARKTPVSYLVVCCVALSLTHCSASRLETQLSPEKHKQYEIVQKRFRDPAHENLMNAAGWTLCHCANQNEVQRVEKTLSLLGTLTDSSRMSELVEFGGMKKLKDSVAELLKNKDRVIRASGAISLGVIGDTTYTSRIAKLVEDKPRYYSTESDDRPLDQLLENYDRSYAAMALGLMRAETYAPRLSALLQSPNYHDRAGAALGLGFMGAKEYIADIATLLEDDDDQVQTAAMRALGELDAKDYSRSIAKLLRSDGDPMVSETACYTLARLNAQEQVDELAVLLNDRFRKGDAAKALALLAATDHTEAIARLIEDSEPLVRCDALIALGILDAREYLREVAAHLQDKKTYVRAYAAVALLLMRDQTNLKQIVDVVLTEWRLPEIVSDGTDTMTYFRARIELHPVVVERQSQLTTQATKAWARLNQTRE